MESIVYPYVNVLEGPGNYFSLSMSDYIDVLYFIENMVLLISKTFFSFCSIIGGALQDLVTNTKKTAF